MRSQTGEPPPVDRNKDPVYRSTTNVVRAVMDMSKGVHQAKADQYVELVKVCLAFGWLLIFSFFLSRPECWSSVEVIAGKCG